MPFDWLHTMAKNADFEWIPTTSKSVTNKEQQQFIVHRMLTLNGTVILSFSQYHDVLAASYKRRALLGIVQLDSRDGFKLCWL